MGRIVGPNGGRAVALNEGVGQAAAGTRAGAGAGTTLLGASADWNVADILAGTPPPQFARAALAYKTGTSYGYRTGAAWNGSPTASARRN